MRAVLVALLAVSGMLPAVHDRVRAQQEQPRFRLSTRLVQVSVIVQDKYRRPIRGLTAADFQIFDSGEEQRIELFLPDAEPGPAAPVAAAAMAAAAGTTSPVQIVNNRAQSSRSATVILFDQLNTRSEDQLHARQQLVKFVEQVRGDDRVAVYVMQRGGFLVLHDFTNDLRSLVRAVQRYNAMASNELTASLDRGFPRVAQFYTEARADGTITAFQSLASHLVSIDGRKNVIWVSGGFPLQALTASGTSMSTRIEHATRPLNDANIALYGVDARGLIPAMQYDRRGIPRFTTLTSARANLDIIETIAEETGARAFFSTNDLSGAIRRAVDDASVAYTLGYYPTHGKWDGSFRPIEVKVNRRGVDVRHRRGYMAAVDPPRRPADAIQAALQSPLDATGLELSAQLERIEGGDIRVTVATAPGSITFAATGESWTGTVDLSLVQKLGDASTVNRVDRTLDLGLDRDEYYKTRTQGFSINGRVTLHPQVQNLHIIVHDRATGNTGSIVVPANRLQALFEASAKSR